MTKIKILTDWRNADKWSQWLKKWESGEMSKTKENRNVIDKLRNMADWRLIVKDCNEQWRNNERLDKLRNMADSRLIMKTKELDIWTDTINDSK